MGMICDAPSPAQATPLVYTGIGVLYNNTPLVPVGPGGALVVNGSSAGANSLVPAPTNLTAAGVYSVLMGGPCRVTSHTSYVHCPPGQPQNDTAEQFAVFPTAGSSLSSGQPLVAGSNLLLKSLQTNKYCRVVTVGAKRQILCDVDDARAASVMSFTGSGFSYQVRAGGATALLCASASCTCKRLLHEGTTGAAQFPNDCVHASLCRALALATSAATSRFSWARLLARARQERSHQVGATSLGLHQFLSQALRHDTK